MKEFNLARALAGDPAVTRDGKSVKIFTDKSTHPSHPVIGELIGNEGQFALRWRINGQYGTNSEASYDLFMAPVKKQEWYNVYSHVNSITMPYSLGSGAYPSEEAAKKYAEHEQLPNYVKSVLIRKWEE